ncbi:MAG: AMP-binding protein [Candidatus Omnitrophota bacterium]|nr:MAG: AMP-binding protein [Candidatus Omnitrophota bacterium]
MADTLCSRLEKVVKRLPDKRAIIYFDGTTWRSLSYDGFYKRIKSTASYIIQNGIASPSHSPRVSRGGVQSRPTDKSKIAIILGNSPEWAIAYFSVIYSGCIAVPIDVQDSSENIKNILIDSEACGVFISDDIFDRLKPAIEPLNLKRFAVRPLERNSHSQGLTPTVDSPLFTDIASLLYTSGTTAAAKGVILTHKNFISDFDSINLTGLCTEKDKMVCCLPLFHSYPFMINLVLPLLTGASVIFTPSLKGEDLLSSMKDNRATIFVGVPELFAMIYKKIAQKISSINILLRIFIKAISELLWLLRKKTGLNLSKFLFAKIHSVFGKELRFFASGGARLDPVVAKGLFKLGFTVLEGYGLTETSPVVTFNPISKPKIGSAGIPIDGVEVKIEEPSPSGIGEILIKGENVMSGYYKKPEQTKEVIRQGWFYSGDLGYKDEDGYVFITGRKKELIVLSSGKNIYPEDIEAYYKRSEFIKEICVFDPAAFGKSETGIFALVIPDMDTFRRFGETDIDRVIRGKIEDLSKATAPHTRITDFRISLEELPKTRLGKIKRYKAHDAFKRLYQVKVYRKPAPLTEWERIVMQHPVFKTIINYMESERKFEGEIRPGDSLELGLGLDSLGRIELLSMLEEAFNITIPQKTAAGWFTLKDAVEGVKNLTKRIPSEEILEKPVIVEKKFWEESIKKLPPVTLLNKIEIAPAVHIKILTFLVVKLIYAYFRVFYKLRIYGRENIPEQGPYILCVNHTSYYDAFLVAASVAFKSELNLYFMGFRGYFEVPIIRNTIKAGKIIPVDTAKDLLPAMCAASYVLRHKRSLCVFPEGERPIDGKMKKFKKGVGILSKELNIPLVPVVIKGAFRAWPRSKTFPGIHPIQVNFGKP